MFAITTSVATNTSKGTVVYSCGRLGQTTMMVVVNSFEKYQYAPSGHPRLRVILGEVCLSWRCWGIAKKGVGCKLLLLMESITSLGGLRSLVFTRHALQEGI